jgi:hypothetical protein
LRKKPRRICATRRGSVVARLSPSRPGQSRLASERGEIGAQVHFKDGRPRNPARRLTMKHALMSAADTV